MPTPKARPLARELLQAAALRHAPRLVEDQQAPELARLLAAQDVDVQPGDVELGDQRLRIEGLTAQPPPAEGQLRMAILAANATLPSEPIPPTKHVDHKTTF